MMLYLLERGMLLPDQGLICSFPAQDFGGSRLAIGGNCKIKQIFTSYNQ